MFDTTLSILPQVDIYPHPLPKKDALCKQTNIGWRELPYTNI